MELVDKPGCKSAVWKYFGLKCDEEKRPVIDGHAFCRQCKNKVAARNGNTSNLIAHLRNNRPTIFMPTLQNKRLRRLSSTPVIKAHHNKYLSQRRLLAVNLTIEKARNGRNLLIQSRTVLRRICFLCTV